MGLCNGLGRGILPSTSRLAFPPLFRLHPGQTCLRFSVPPLRARSSSVGFQQDHKPNKKPPSFAGHKSPLLSGRLPFHGFLPRRPGKSHLLRYDSLQKPGSKHKFQKIPPFSLPVSGVSGSSLPPRHIYCPSHSQKFFKFTIFGLANYL